jgi:hypothetical protein
MAFGHPRRAEAERRADFELQIVVRCRKPCRLRQRGVGSSRGIRPPARRWSTSPRSESAVEWACNYSQLVLLSPGAGSNPGSRAQRRREPERQSRPAEASPDRFIRNNNYLFGAGGSSTQAIRPPVDSDPGISRSRLRITAPNTGAPRGMRSAWRIVRRERVPGSGVRVLPPRALEAT